MDHLDQIKKEKHLLRMRKNDDEQTAQQLLRDLEQRKEKELRAQIEKEEIQRQIKVSPSRLTSRRTWTRGS